jgi:transcriptional regulator with XRE-family HTH domain
VATRKSDTAVLEASSARELAGARVPEAEPASDVDPGYRLLGSRLQGLRKMKGLSLQDVANEVNLSRSFLSLVERGQTDLSLSRFSRLTEFYGIHPSELLMELNSSSAEPEAQRIDEARAVERGEGVDYRVLQEGYPQIVMTRLAPGARFTDLRAHRGEDFWIVLEGEVTLVYGARERLVPPGTTVRFSGTIPHGLVNASDAPAAALGVCSFPYW